MGGTQFFLPVEVSKSIGRFECDGEAGWNFIQHAQGLWALGGIAGYFPSDMLELLVELHAGSVLSPAAGGEQDETFLNFGCRYKFTEKLLLLAAAGKNITPAGFNEYLGYLGLQFLM